MDAGKVTFNGDRLEDVIRELNRHVSRPLVIRDPRLRRTPIGGAFDTHNADAYAEDLTEFFGKDRVGPTVADSARQRQVIFRRRAGRLRRTGVFR